MKLIDKLIERVKDRETKYIHFTDSAGVEQRLSELDFIIFCIRQQVDSDNQYPAIPYDQRPGVVEQMRRTFKGDAGFFAEVIQALTEYCDEAVEIDNA